MRPARIGGVLCVALLVGCAAIERAPQHDAPQVAMPSGVAVSIEPSVAPPAPSPEPPRTTGAGPAPVAAAPTISSAAPTMLGAAGRNAAKPEPSTPTAQAKVPSKPAPAAQYPKTEAPTLAKPDAQSPLDLKSLETRLKETKAIGVFTKLTLKNQVDDLLDQFRAFYQGRVKTSLAELRRSYDMLVLKVLALLQDADPPLASAIAASRESLWSILSNPEKFSTV